MEKNLNSAKQRIKYIIDKEGISKRKFYEKTGIANSTLDQKSGLTESNLVKFLYTYPEISPEWILLGRGEIYKKTYVDLAAEPTSSYRHDVSENSLENRFNDAKKQICILEQSLKDKEKIIQLLEDKLSGSSK